MKTGLKIFIGFIVFFIFQDLISQQITYSGTVQYRSINTTKASGGGSDKHWNWNVDIDQKFIIEGTFYVTFTGGISPVGVAMYQMTSIEGDIHIENTVNNESNDEKVFQFCYDGYMRYKRTETPGDSRIKKLAVKWERSDPDKPCIFSGNLSIISPPSNNKKEPTSGKYIIMLMGEIKIDVTHMSYDEEKFPCDPTINKPPSSITKTNKMNFPIVIAVEKGFDGSNILEGRKVIKDEHNTITKKGSSHGMQHGDMDYFYDHNITVSWTLVKRTKECDANLTKVNGDVKINGVPVKEGNVKIAAGDMISTGDKSRMQINMPGGNEVIMLGPNSNFLVKDPCKLTPPKNMDFQKSVRNFIRGKVYQVVGADNSEFEVKTRTAVTGFRGQISPVVKEYYCSNNNIEVRGGPSFNLQEVVDDTDPEKESMIKEFGDLSGYKAAFYIHTEPEAIYDVSAIKGDILVESTFGSDKMVVKEGSTATSWPNGTPFFDIYISAK